MATPGHFQNIDGQKGFRRLAQVFASPLVVRAIQIAHDSVSGEKRKIPPGEKFKPDSVMEHLMQTGMFVAWADGTAEEVAAGIVHDLIEDDRAWTKERMNEELSPSVTEIVLPISKPELDIEDRAQRWHARNDAYAQNLRNAIIRGNRGSPLVCCADKFSNISTTVWKISKGIRPSTLMGHPWQWDLKRWLDLLDILREAVPSGAYDQLSSKLFEFYSTAARIEGDPDIELLNRAHESLVI